MNLNLAIKERFNSTMCDFYVDENKEILLTREQIGEALEYAKPGIQIGNIHNKHKERLDKFSVLIKTINTDDGKAYDTYYYNTKGIMEICRWSRQPKADMFMDFVWDIAEKIIKGQPVQNNFAEQDRELLVKVVELLVKQQEKTNSAPPPSRPSSWVVLQFKKINCLADYFSVDRNEVMKNLWRELENRYDIDIDDYRAECIVKTGNKNPFTLDIAESIPEIKNLVQLILDELLEKFSLPPIKREFKPTLFDLAG